MGYRVQPLLTFLIMIALLSCPLIVNGSPFYIADSASYLKGGQYALSLVGDRLFAEDSNSLAGEEASVVVQKVAVVGARSPVYSVLSALLRYPASTMMLLALVQTAALAYVIFHVAKINGFKSQRSMVGLAMFIALFSSAPWYSALVVPDILAGLGICAIAILAVHMDLLSRTEKTIFAGLAAVSVACHASHIPLIAVMVMAASLLILVFPLRQFNNGRMIVIAWLFGSLLAGLGTSMVAGFIGFGDASPIAKRYPFALARSVVDGPARLHLEKNCVQYKYAICELFTEFPRNIDDFLWTDKGIRMRASPEQMNRIRQEESLILSRTAREYPVEMIKAFAWNSFSQLLTFGISDILFGQRLVPDESGFALQTESPGGDSLLPVLDRVHYAVAGASFFYICMQLWTRSLHRSDLLFLSLLAIGLVSNAAICGGLSAVAERYQGRVVWIIPLTAAMLFYRSRLSKRAC